VISERIEEILKNNLGAKSRSESRSEESDGSELIIDTDSLQIALEKNISPLSIVSSDPLLCVQHRTGCFNLGGLGHVGVQFAANTER
jgi:hypothetical protein